MLGLKEIKAKSKIKNPFKRIRIEARLTQQEVAEKMGNAQSQKLVSNLELSRNVSVGTIERWGKVFGLEWDQLETLIKEI